MQTQQVFTDRQWDILRAVHVWQFAGVDELRPDDTAIVSDWTVTAVADMLIAATIGSSRLVWRSDADALIAVGFLGDSDYGPFPIGRFRLDGTIVEVASEAAGGNTATIVVRAGDQVDRYLPTPPERLPRCRFYVLTPPGIDALAGADDAGDKYVVPTTPPPEPSRKAIQAYRAVKFLGLSQTKVADELRTNQGQVSRWVTQVAAWNKAGNVLPDMDAVIGEPTDKPIAVDPAKLDMRPRQRTGTKARLKAHQNHISND